MSKTELFAAIDVGSYELGMKIFELSGKGSVKELEHIVHRIDLGSETYKTGRISPSHIREICTILKEYHRMMKTYGIKAYRACGTSAMRETRDIQLVQDLIYNQTGIEVAVLSNSEQRFIDYKSVALQTKHFRRVMEKTAAILDIGGGSVQISIFHHDKLAATQNLRLGVLRLNTIMNEIGAPVERYDSLISEIVLPQVDHFRKMYLQENRIRNLIVVDDYLSPILHRMRKQHRAEDFIPGKELELYVSQYAQKPVMTVAQELQVPLENIPLLRIAAALVTSVANRIGVESIWAPGVTLCDGLVYEYAEQKKWMDEKHDFEQDIVACAVYHIIMSTEMIGLSHREREMVANIVRFNHTPFETILDAPERYTDLSEEEYLVIAKLSAILRVANGLDRTHKQKFKEVHFRIQQEKLVIAIDSAADITVEKGMFERRALFFEEVFGILPVIRQKKERGVAE